MCVFVHDTCKKTSEVNSPNENTNRHLKFTKHNEFPTKINKHTDYAFGGESYRCIYPVFSENMFKDTASNCPMSAMKGKILCFFVPHSY